MVGESNQNVFLIQIDVLSFAEFEISEFEISRVDCTYKFELSKVINIRNCNLKTVLVSFVLRNEQYSDT